jgi:hypothetical protein
MKLTLTSLTLGLAAIGMTALSGCGKPDESVPAPSSTDATSTGDDHGHAHDEGGHSHGDAPHGGTLADWGGGDYHVEFIVDHDKQQAVVYVLGDDAKTPAPVKADMVLLSITEPSFQMELAASPLEGEADGTSSRFVGTHESLGIVREFAGSISAEVDGTPYVAEFKEEAHGHGHGHSHSGDDALVWEGEPKDHAGMVIKLGHHGQHLHAGEAVEPAVSITRDGKPVDNVKVFNALVSEDGNVVAKEVATVYEPTTAEEPAHYAQGELAIPAGVQKVVIRFRIVPPGADEVTYDVPVAVE